MKKVFIAHSFQQTVMEKFIENNTELCWLIQLNVHNRQDDVYLFNLVFENDPMPENVLPNTSVSGVIYSSKNLAEKAAKLVESNPKIDFALFYNFDFNTYKISASKSEVKIEYTEWMIDLVGIYSYLCWPRTDLESSENEIKAQFKGKKFLYVNEFGTPLNCVSNGSSLTLTDKNSKENALRIADLKKYHLNRDPGTTLKSIFMFNLELWTIAENDNEACQIIDFVKVSKVYADQVTYVFVDELANNHVTIFEKFLNQLMNTSPGMPSFLTANHKNCFLVKAKKQEFDMETIGSSVRSLFRFHPNKLRNVHFSLINSLPQKKYLVDPNYIYFHYLQDNSKDDGWGCAYRSLQTIVSWYVLNGYKNIEIPTIEKIQQTLVDIGDKNQSFIGSSEWIGSAEISFVLNRLLGIDCQFYTFKFGSEIVNNIPKLKQHFETVKTPIMIGGTVLAWTLLGIAVDEDSPQNSKFLILDPHYKGKDEMKTVTGSKSKAVYWSDHKIFKSDASYNFCCPLIPRGV